MSPIDSLGVNCSMLINNKYNGKIIGEVIKDELERSTHMEIASGYFFYELINELTRKLLKVAKRGSCKLLFGMFYHDRAIPEQRDCLIGLNQKLKDINDENGIYITTKRYHGKIFKFKNEHEEKFFMSSLNIHIRVSKTI